MATRVIIESPLHALTMDLALANLNYAERAFKDSLRRREAPLASHLLYPRYLDDADPAERQQGLNCGFAWTAVAELVAVYVDQGLSDGMLQGIQVARKHNIPFELRSLNVNYPAAALKALRGQLLAAPEGYSYSEDLSAPRTQDEAPPDQTQAEPLSDVLSTGEPS